MVLPAVHDQLVLLMTFTLLISQGANTSYKIYKKNVHSNMFCTCVFYYQLDLQMINIGLRVLARPISSSLPKMYQKLGLDYDERVLPSIMNEVKKLIV
jgi:hypothetical protein